MYQIVKRLFDIASSFLALVVLSPILIFAAIGIVVSDPGPVFYMASRVGKDNKVFKMYKFRSMRVDNSANEKSFKADKNRIFPFGEFLRMSKIDELPQLLNVLFGQMSVVGPRPAAVDQADITRGGKYAIASTVKPGLSGPSAIFDYIYGDKVEDEQEYEAKVLYTRMELDVFYVKVRTVIYDIKVIVYTVISILYTIFGETPQWMLDELYRSASSVTMATCKQEGV